MGKLRSTSPAPMDFQPADYGQVAGDDFDVGGDDVEVGGTANRVPFTIEQVVREHLGEFNALVRALMDRQRVIVEQGLDDETDERLFQIELSIVLFFRIAIEEAAGNSGIFRKEERVSPLGHVEIDPDAIRSSQLYGMVKDLSRRSRTFVEAQLAAA